MKSVLILLSLVIVAITSYGLLMQKEVVTHDKQEKVIVKTNNIPKRNQTIIKPTAKKNQHADTEIDTVDDVETSLDTEEINGKLSPKLGEDLQSVTYEQIENDTSLSDEEKETKIMDKVYFEAETKEPTVHMTDEKVLKMIIEDMENELPENE